MGGGGFTMGERNPALDCHVLALTGKPIPKVCFIPTASGDTREQALRFEERFGTWPCEPSVLSLFHLAESRLDPTRHLLAQDAIYVGGGSMRNMLAIWRLHGVEDALRNAYRDGTILTGWSAGCICWFEAGITDSFTLELGPLRDGLGLLSGSACPHYDSQKRRRPVYAREIAAGLPEGGAPDDAGAARCDAASPVAIVSATTIGRPFSVDRDGEHPSAVRSP